jgi:hypothetical protein
MSPKVTSAFATHSSLYPFAYFFWLKTTACAVYTRWVCPESPSIILMQCS